ncbi:hypothetical protein ILYODFUR_016285 [Ilyodon furcidens]|uniref:Uncharacterized protein n=1 Tax=Ilyodon furcidens TaxID=33524 RepID=A0ABV0TJE1_9TELE
MQGHRKVGQHFLTNKNLYRASPSQCSVEQPVTAITDAVTLGNVCFSFPHLEAEILSLLLCNKAQAREHLCASVFRSCTDSQLYLGLDFDRFLPVHECAS